MGQRGRVLHVEVLSNKMRLSAQAVMKVWRSAVENGGSVWPVLNAASWYRGKVESAVRRDPGSSDLPGQGGVTERAALAQTVPRPRV